MIALEGQAVWVQAALDILELALAEIGVGAKTSSGYGRLRFDTPRRTVEPTRRQSHASGSPPLRLPSEPATSEPQAPKPSPTALPAVGDVVSGSLAGFLDQRKRDVRVKLNRVPPYVTGVIAARLVNGRTSGGLNARVTERVDERGTIYLYLEPVKA